MSSPKRATVNRLLICLTGILYATNYWYRGSIAPITDVLQSEFSATSGQIGLISALFWFGYVILQIPSGLLLQYVTAESVAIASGLLFAVAAFVFALPSDTDSIVLPSVIMILSGIASAPVLLVTFKLIAETLGSNAVPYIGGAIAFVAAAAQGLGNYLQAVLWQRYTIWREMYLGCSVLIFVLFIVLYMTSVIKYQTTPIDDNRNHNTKESGYGGETADDTSKEKRDSRKDMHQSEQTNSSNDTSQNAHVSVVSQITRVSPQQHHALHVPAYSTSTVPQVDDESATTTDATKHSKPIYCCKILVFRSNANAPAMPPCESMKLALSNPWNYILGLHWCSAVSLAYSLNGLWLISYMSLKFGYSRESSTMINGLFLGAHAFGNVVLGKLSTKYRRRKIFYIVSSLGLLSPLYIIYCGPNANTWIIMALNAICGFCTGIAPIEFGLVCEYNDYFGCSDIAGGIVNSTALLLGGTGLQWIMGVLMDVSWTQREGEYDEETGDRVYSVRDYDLAFSVIPAVITLNWIITLIIKETNGEMVQWDKNKRFCSRYFGRN